MTCDDLRLGGTLSAAGLTGGTSVNSTALAVSSWSELFTRAGIFKAPLDISGRPGQNLVGDGLGTSRLSTLSLTITKWGANGVGSLTEADPNIQLKANTDVLMGLLAESDGNYLEVDMPDGTKRFSHVTALDRASITQRVRRGIGVPLFSEWPYWWVGGAQSSDTISGTNDIVTIGGNVYVYDAVLVFSGNGILTHNDLGWTLEITGATGANTVDLGARTIIQAGLPVPANLIRNNRDWGWFVPGANDMTLSAGTVTMTWRNQYG